MEIIYNLFEYVRVKTGISATIDGYDAVGDQTGLLLVGTGGEDTPVSKVAWDRFQFVYRDSSKYQTRKKAQEIFDKVTNRFCVTLPEITVGGDLYSEVVVGSLLAMQKPTYMGTTGSGNGLHTVVFNIRITV